jgi:PAS domain S-box-containing protein
MSSISPKEADLRRQVDRRQLREIIAGLAEGILLIDPEEGIVWANECALAMHDVEDLAGLGRRAADYRERFLLKYRNNHVLTESQYPIDRLLGGESFRDVTVQLTKPGDAAEFCVILIMRGFALTDSGGEVESYALVMENVTERYTAEERFERTFAANPAPAVICRLSDLRYVKVNQGFLEMTGYAREDLIGRSAYEVDILEKATRRDAAIAALHEGCTIPQMESTLRLPDGGSKLVIVAGQPIEVGEESCMLFTFMDIEPRRRAEDALKQSEERFARSFRLTPIPPLLSACEDMRILDVNEAFMVVFGYTHEEAVGRRGADLPIWLDREGPRRLDSEIRRSGSARNVEIALQTKAGEHLDALLSAETVSIHGQDCVLTVIQDITERKRGEIELIAAIEAVMQDTSWFSRTVIEKLANLRRPGRADAPLTGLDDLTDRELEILGLMCQGMSDAEICKTLGLTRNTVRNYVARIYGKIDVHSRAAAVVWGRERGLTAPRKG